MAKAIMIQGAGSNVGKSMIVAGLARALVNRGYSVCPFKPQNMSNNAAVTRDGGEIGRAQALQAMAARVAPIVDMNPILLKPETDVGAQVVVRGQRRCSMKAKEYGAFKESLLPEVLSSFKRLAGSCDIVLVEGAGSPAEINLRAGDIANMGFAEAASVPVVLIGDIDRGGVIAQVVGTHAVLPEEDRQRIKAFAINKFRGDVSLFDEGLTEICDRTGWRSLGVLPWFPDAGMLPAEDIMDIRATHQGTFKIAVPRLNRIANFDDLDPLLAEETISVEIVEPGCPLPGDANLILIPGSKSTIADLAHFRAQGWDIDLAAHIRRGGHVLGICGGYQMLGKELIDDMGLEGTPTRVKGLGHLDVITKMLPEKRLELSNGRHIETGLSIKGYEIHIGETDGKDCANAAFEVGGRPEGAASGNVVGCYLHGIFAADEFRRAFFAKLGLDIKPRQHEAQVEETLDALAAHLELHFDIDGLLALAEPVET
ncbi:MULTISPECIES: cobyric acid synthase [Halocynthiibacter]|uniref:Cobyric acid synthase n=1 Tax=Halocynthiibacter halioticoli TaxID=2986804 RepID=A0AAE3J1I5_9RHOB|nr:MULTISPECIES: cobyric acid synthase [Halocynthiibacter]MCV6825005.1 cobyric acid synthase [Halocynthiibacter halioticoli]MCW4058006.1 cobyric acid synthase [Halocynthiibacter sp. SDUM655004]